jgi:hypothetical protein
MFFGKLDESAKIAFDAGFRHGRQGVEAMNRADPTYMLGYRKGEAALESYQNSDDRAVY